MTKKFLISAALALTIACTAFAQFDMPEIAEHESGTQKIMFIESEKILYNFRWTMEKFAKDNKTFIRFKGYGDNDKKAAAERIEWTEESLAELTANGIRSVYWEKKSTGAEQMSWLLEYDWTNLKAHYSWSDALTNKKEEKELKFTQDAISGDALYLVLRSFPFEKGAGYKYKAQIVLTDGSVINGYVINHGLEKLETAFGVLDAYKLELKPVGVVGAVAPDMFIWYTKSKPHIWLRFDGRDEGLFAPRTKNVLLQYSPAEWIKP